MNWRLVVDVVGIGVWVCVYSLVEGKEMSCSKVI